VLGDKQFNFFAASISQYRTISGSFVNLSRRFQYALQGFSQTEFFYGQLGGVFYDPTLSPIIDRDLALATRTMNGGSAFAIWPFNRYRRIELSAGVVSYDEEFSDPSLEQYSQEYQEQVYGQQLFHNGTAVPIGLSYVQETTVFREFGPLSGNTMKLSYEIAPKIGDTLSRQTVEADVRYYKRIAGSGLLALRGRGFKSWGDAPTFSYFGGNADLRGYEYLQFIGNNTFYGNAELRFPLVEAMLTPIGILGGIRGVFFAGAGGAYFNNSGFKFWDNNTLAGYVPIIGYSVDPATGQYIPIEGDPVDISGFRLVDGRASYGFGLETFALGFPIHFDWAWRTLFNKSWEDALFASSGGSHEFRRPQFKVWVGYDF
jgi:outer membrane protein assembly factor BamA